MIHDLKITLIALLCLASLTGSSWADEPGQSAESVAPPSFPTNGLMPKEEIGALRFLKLHGEYDGRGVVVAIFDTGVDPAVAGLQTTSDGKPKIIDMIDGTGSGDVDTTTIRQASDGAIEGLSGRRLKLDPKWKATDGKFHVGIRRGYDLFPRGLVRRLKRERRKKFSIIQHQTEANLRRQIGQWDTTHPRLSAAEKKERAELQTRLDQLLLIDRRYEDPGPIYDCVVFHDGSDWRAVIDTDEDGDLADETPLTNYRKQRGYSTFGGGAELNFTVNIFQQGNRLSIVVPSGEHGTHVAGIVAGYYPQQRELDGVAPGAQIVSVKIGDTRLGSMETGGGLERGLIAAVRNQCDLINMSYGEPTTTPNRGRLADLFSDIVDRHGIVFVASAGNSGPALETVGAPGGTTSAVIGVGAYVSPDMLAQQHVLRDSLKEMPYTWTSRGPTADGALGVDLFAPGGAIAPIPNWSLARNAQMSGTSMASPNACGALALLISGLKESGTPYSPYSLRRALQNTARPVESAEVFAQGAGLIQVDAAYEYLTKHATAVGEQLRLAVDLPGRETSRGVYLRELSELRRPTEFSLRVRPIFPELADNREKIDFELRLALECSQDWVRCGSHLLLGGKGKTIQVEVDPTGLQPGLHYAEVRGYDANDAGRGALIRLPVTVIVPRPAPQEIAEPIEAKLRFVPGQVKRQFFAVPSGAIWAELRLRTVGDVSRRQFVAHTTPQRTAALSKSDSGRHFITLEPEAEEVRHFPVVGGRTMELCLAQNWSSLGDTELEYELRFRGLSPSSHQLLLTPGQGAEVDVTAALGKQRLAPSATLTERRAIVVPDSSEITPLSAERDLLPGGRQIYQLTLTYKFKQPSAGSVTPRFPQTDGLLYDSPLGTQFWMLFDSAKRKVAADDVWPSAIRLAKGSYLLRLQLRHTDVKRLEGVKRMVLYLDRPLRKSISLQVYPSRTIAAQGGPKFSPRRLEPGQRVSLYIAPPSTSQTPSDLPAGEMLLGAIRYTDVADSQRSSGSQPGSFPLVVAVGPKKSAGATAPQSKTVKQKKDKQLADEWFEFKLGQLKRLGEAHAAQRSVLEAELLKERPGDLGLLTARLHRLDNEKLRKTRLVEVIAAADAVLAQIDSEQMARHFGENVAADDPVANQKRKEMTHRRDILIDTLYRKGRALGYMELPEVLQKHPINDPLAHDKAFEENFAQLSRWVDTTEKKYFLLHIRRERRQGRFGNALALLNKYIPDAEPNYWYIKKRRDLYESLGWEHWRAQENAWLSIRFPKQYDPF